MSFSTLTGSLSTALSGLNAAQARIDSTAHNIVNAGTDGFTRKQVSQESRVLAGRGAGVDSTLVTRIADEYLTGEIRRQTAITGESAIINTYYERLQDTLGNPASDQDIASRIGALQASLEAFGNDHQTFALGQDVVGSTNDLTIALDRLSDQVQSLRSEANRDIDRLVDGINDDLKAIDDLNNEITNARNAGEQNPDLVDKRDQLIQSVSEKIEIDIYALDDGAIAIYTADGEALLDSEPRVLYYAAAGSITPDAPISALSIFRERQIDPETGTPFDPDAGAVLVSSGVRAVLTPELQGDAVPDADQIITSRIQGGEIQGLIELRDRIFPELNDQIQELAAGLQFALNAAHNDAVAWPQPSALSGSRTDLADFAGATRSGLATIAVTDGNDGSTLLAFQIDMAAVADETALASQINANLGAFGTAAIGADGQLAITLASADQGIAIAEGDSSIRIVDAAGRERDYGFSHYFGLNDLLVQDGPLSTDLAVQADLAADPARLATARLDVETPPLEATLGGPGDNRGAKGLILALEDEQSMIARGALPERTTDLASYAAEIIAITSADARRAEARADNDRALSDAVNFKAAAVSSVNIDEELSSLITLQQAYTAAARLITIVGEMLDELGDVVR